MTFFFGMQVVLCEHLRLNMKKGVDARREEKKKMGLIDIERLYDFFNMFSTFHYLGNHIVTTCICLKVSNVRKINLEKFSMILVS